MIREYIEVRPETCGLISVFPTGTLVALGPAIVTADDPRVGIQKVEVDPDQPHSNESAFASEIENRDQQSIPSTDNE